MSAEPRRRPRRIPFTPEEVANIIAVKKRKELLQLIHFKRSKGFKLQNVFNVCCFFIYWEVLICFFGPSNYDQYAYTRVETKYGNHYSPEGKAIVESVELKGADGNNYRLMIQDFVDLPAESGSFVVAHDFLLHKKLKASYAGISEFYRLYEASPILIIVLLALVTSSVAYFYNLNENPGSLTAVTFLNALALLALICI